MGDYRNGKLYKLTRNAFTYNGDIIRSVRRTGFVTHGTTNNKRCDKVRFRLKRSTANSSVSNPVMTVRWREKNGPWSNERQVSLGAAGQHDIWVELKQLGMYRCRQWEFAHTDATDWILADGKEFMTVLSR